MGIFSNTDRKTRGIGGARETRSVLRRKDASPRRKVSARASVSVDDVVPKIFSIEALIRLVLGTSFILGFWAVVIIGLAASFKIFLVPENISGPFDESYKVSMNTVTSEDVAMTFSESEPDQIILSNGVYDDGKIAISEMNDGRQAFIFISSIVDSDFSRLMHGGKVQLNSSFMPVKQEVGSRGFYQTFEVKEPIDIRQVFSNVFRSEKLRNVSISAINGRMIFKSNLKFDEHSLDKYLNSIIEEYMDSMIDGFQYSYSAILNKMKNGNQPNHYFEKKLTDVDMRLYPGDRFIVAGEDGNIVVATSRRFPL